MKIKFESIEQFIESLKQNNDIVGILEYGGRHYDDMAKGGDYDLTVITRNPISKSIGGLHFNIAGIPIDCMIKSIDDFMLSEPSSDFELAHLKSNMLFDRDTPIFRRISWVSVATRRASTIFFALYIPIPGTRTNIS